MAYPSSRWSVCNAGTSSYAALVAAKIKKPGKKIEKRVMSSGKPMVKISEVRYGNYTRDLSTATSPSVYTFRRYGIRRDFGPD